MTAVENGATPRNLFVYYDDWVTANLQEGKRNESEGATNTQRVRADHIGAALKQSCRLFKFQLNTSLPSEHEDVERGG